MHSKVHVGLVIFLVANNNHLVKSVISYSAFMYQVLEGKDVSDNGLVKPHILDVA